MAPCLKYGVFSILGLVLISPCAIGSDSITTVSSLSGLQTAINNAPSSGLTIKLATGVYHQSRPIRVHGKQNLTIEGGSSDRKDTVIQGPGINDSSLSINIKVNNSDHLTIRNLSLRDSYYHGVQINNDSDYFTADNLKTVDNGESGFKVTSPSNASGPSAYSDNGVITNSYIGFTNTGQRGVVEGVDMVAVEDWTIRNNVFNRIRKPNGHPAYAAFAKGNSKNVTFEQNMVMNSFIGLSFGGGGTGARYFRNGDQSEETRGGVIRDNLIYNSTDVGIYMNKAHNFEISGNNVLLSGKKTGSIGIRYPQSSGDVHDNRTTGKIRLRNRASADLADNTRLQ